MARMTSAEHVDELPPAERCSAHPGRLAVDRCPVCTRPRCGADRLPSGGCTLCQIAPEDPAAVRRKPKQPELLVRGVLAAYGTAVVWAFVTAEYVGAGWFQYLAPGLLGILCGGAAVAAAASPRPGVLLLRVRVASVVCSLLGVGLGFLLENPFTRPSLQLDVVLPYLIAAVGAWFWTAPPQPRKRRPVNQEGAGSRAK